MERHDKQIKASMAIRSEKEGCNLKPSKVIPVKQIQLGHPLVKKMWQTPHLTNQTTALRLLVLAGVDVGVVVPLLFW